MDVKKLPLNVRCLLSASARINNYKKLVEELVYNSLDAESTCIAIRIHIEKNWLQVVDNGIGIKKADYKLLGERYATSKLIDIYALKAVPNKNGYQGQALANIIEVSQVVKVTSRCADSDDTWVKIFFEGKIKSFCEKAPTRPSKGTTVEINGFLYNVNVQRKCINTFNELQDIKTFLEQLLLAFNNVSVSLRDDSENEIVFKMHKNRDIFQTLNSVFDIATNDVQELQVEKNEYKVKAFISVGKKSNTNFHWIYLNNKFIDTSNLHKIINKKLNKPNSSKHKKIKTKGAYKSNEHYIICESVPFYVLFISCPYYEYDILNSGKQTIVEFKDWLQINNLIEKLIKFYNGDINLKILEKNEKPVFKHEETTRGEVKRIMEKILGNPYKLGKISQMQNGIKGKQIRRKKKKQQPTLTNKIQPKINAHENQENPDILALTETKRDKKSISKRSDIKVYPEPSKAVLKSKNRANKTHNKDHKITKNWFKCNCNKNYNNIIEMFRNGTNTIKRRCDELSCNIKDLANMSIYKKVEDLSTNQIKNKWSVINTEPADIVEFNNVRNRKTIIEQFRSYDLLQTVLNTQQHFYNQEPKKENTFTPINKSNVQPGPFIKSYNCAPKLTFESHNYNINSTSIKKTAKVHFINKQSRDNFNTVADKRNTHIPIKTSETTKYGNLVTGRTNNKHDISNFDRILNKYNQGGSEPAFSINLSGTDIVQLSKQIRNQVMNDMNSLFDNDNYDKNSNTKTQLNFGLNINIERTYTILKDSFYNSLQTQQINAYNDCKAIRDERNKKITEAYHDANHYNHAYNTSKNIFTPQTLCTSRTNFYEAFDICEAILNSPKNNQKDSNISCFPKEDSSLIIKETGNINDVLRNENAHEYDVNKTIQNGMLVEPNKEKDISSKVFEELLSENNCTKKEIDPNKIDRIQENSLYDFKLNTRHRFVPKGMSQIFVNCFSKNLCSYKLDTEYYENEIYDNFVEDVAVNSEIYETKIQNLKEITTKDIQKVTEKIKKQNADLIFKSDSLRSAKVLGQVDCKFIAAIIPGVSQVQKTTDFFVLFDQHAVHERVRLENNLSYYFYQNNWRKVSIDTVSVKSSKEEILYLHNHKDKFSRFGLDWTVPNNSEILVNAIPEAIRGKNPRPLEIIIKTIKDLILEQMHAIKYLKGNVSYYPQSIMMLVFSEACRYAIKFGDTLSKKDCVDLIAALADCKTPFQCAHGRPVMAVMLELEKGQFEYKYNMDNIMQFKTRLN